ncbi:hypothetical protein KM043_005539 [Ampulex compressa]|nr:hypothetical protein KM043_005539 [Ampulex compressa]
MEGGSNGRFSTTWDIFEVLGERMLMLRKLRSRVVVGRSNGCCLIYLNPLLPEFYYLLETEELRPPLIQDAINPTFNRYYELQQLNNYSLYVLNYNFLCPIILENAALLIATVKKSESDTCLLD